MPTSSTPTPPTTPPAPPRRRSRPTWPWPRPSAIPPPTWATTITYTLTLSDNGPNSATNVQVTDLLPAGVSFVSATPSQGTYDFGNGVWTVGTVDTTTPQTLLIQAQVVSPSPQTNTATITGADQFDPVAANNTASVVETPQQADLALTKTVSNPTPNVGDTITYTITLSDNGPDSATNVTILDVLPPGVSYVSSTPSQGTYNPTTGLWIVGTVTTATPQTLLITVTVLAPMSQSSSSITQTDQPPFIPSVDTNTATIASADQFDPNTGNNSASAIVDPATGRSRPVQECKQHHPQRGRHDHLHDHTVR